MSPKRIFRLAYHAAQNSASRFRIHQLRDGDAFAELSPILFARGYEFGGLLLNLPPGNKHALRHIDVSHLTASDLLVLNTRPPVHDEKMGVNRPVLTSHNTLEAEIFHALDPYYFEICARSQMLLSESMADKLLSGFKDRANILFRMNRDGSYLKHRGRRDRYWQKLPDEKKLTAAYLIQIPQLWEDGPGLLAAFGMAGTETLAWNYLLRTRFQDWIGCYQFLMAEIVPGQLPADPTSLSFADQWEVTPILTVPLLASSADTSSTSPILN